MRIALVHSRFNQHGGAERYALDVAAAYCDAGHQVTILSTTPPPAGPWRSQLLPLPRPVTLWRRESAAGKAHRHLSDLWPWRGAVARQIAATRPDVVHLHNWQHIGPGAIRRVARDIPVVHTVHDFALADPATTLDSSGWSRARSALLSARGRMLTAQIRHVWLHWPSERTQRLAAAEHPGLLRNRASILPLSARSTQRLGGARPASPATFLFLGLLADHKGILDLLDAWAARPDPPAQARLLIAGEGPLRTRVEEAARHDRTLSYLGYIDADSKAQALHGSGWLVFPSRWHENFSISCVEALTAARPIISSRVARPPMASDGSVIVYEQPGGLAAVLNSCAQLDRDDYLPYEQSARRDGEALAWDTHVHAMLGLLTAAAAQTGPGTESFEHGQPG